MVKGYRSCCWGTKYFSMGGTNLTNVNYANIPNQIKIIDTLKYYQTTLAGLASTADDKEKQNVKAAENQFINKHIYFGKVWANLTQNDREKVLDMIAEKEYCPMKNYLQLIACFQNQRKISMNILNFIVV